MMKLEVTYIDKWGEKHFASFEDDISRQDLVNAFVLGVLKGFVEDGCLIVDFNVVEE